MKEFECEVKVFVDTAPVPEKALGQAAGLGWQGKHTNLVSRDLGSWFFIGSIFTTLNIEEDSMEISNCGTCTSCLDVCPTNAFPACNQVRTSSFCTFFRAFLELFAYAPVSIPTQLIRLIERDQSIKTNK